MPALHVTIRHLPAAGLRAGLRALPAASALCALLAVAVPPAAAAPPALSSIRVVGADTVQPEQVVGWTGLKIGDPVTTEVVAGALRKVIATGKFADAFVYQSDTAGGTELIFNLVEYPRLQEVRFTGVKKLKETDLREQLPLAPGEFLSPAKLTRAFLKIKEKYQGEGYYNVKLATDSTLIRTPGTHPLVISVEEGKKVTVRKILITGNEKVTADDLRTGWKTKQDKWWRGATFKPAEFDQDLEKLVDNYRNRGYLDAQVVGHRLDFIEGTDKVDLHLQVQEGGTYRVGNVSWSGNTVFHDDRIAQEIRFKTGETFSEGRFQDCLQALHSLYWETGYIYITVEPTRNIHDGLVDVALSFREGVPAHIHDVVITGNSKSHEGVIRRELKVVPGDLFVNSELRDSQRRVFQLGYFNDVRVDFKTANPQGDIDLIMEVEEKQTGTFTMGVGFSQASQATGFLQVGEPNLFGRGQALQFAWQFGRRQNYLDLSFTEPWFRGTPTLLGADLFNRFSNTVNDVYDTRSRGFALRLGRPIPGTRYSRATIRYSLTRTSLSNFAPNYVQTLDALERELGATGVEFQRLDKVNWPLTESALMVTLGRNSTNSPFFPTSGTNTMLRFELTGGPLGGDLSFQETLLEHNWYQPLPLKFVFHMGVSTGLLHAFGSTSDVPDYQKYRLGGNRLYSLRGYRDLEVVPRGNPSFVGGRFYTTLTTEVLYPITRAVSVLAFVDQGDTWNHFGEADLTRLRKGAGFGVRLEVPMLGRVGLDYGYGFDRTRPGWEAHFNFGSFF
jgi:outer membrane protein insertion porin family